MRLGNFLPRVFKVIAILIVVFYCSIAMVIAPHWGLDVCPFAFKNMRQSDFIPVVHGLPTVDIYLKAEKGEILFGGCLVHPMKAVCRHCGWPVKFSL